MATSKPSSGAGKGILRLQSPEGPSQKKQKNNNNNNNSNNNKCCCFLAPPTPLPQRPSGLRRVFLGVDYTRVSSLHLPWGLAGWAGISQRIGWSSASSAGAAVLAPARNFQEKGLGFRGLWFESFEISGETQATVKKPLRCLGCCFKSRRKCQL